MQDSVSYFSSNDLNAFIQSIYEAHGLSSLDASCVARNLVDANSRGLDTHGVARTPSYIERIKHGLVNVKPDMALDYRMPWALNLDADNAMGAIAGDFAMAQALQNADTGGVGAVTVRNSNHFGAAGYYARQAAEQNCIGISLAPASKSLAPFGSREPLFGTNPIAAAVPAGKYAPWVMDMASSVAARGHIRLSEKTNTPIPEGWAFDSEGNPTTDPHEAMKGVMVPFAGPKGSAIAMLVDILGGVLSGSSFAGNIRDMNKDFTAPQGVGHFFLVLKIEAFMSLNDFCARMEEQIERLHDLAPAPGFTNVLYPGEPEAKISERRMREGIPLNGTVLSALTELSREAALDFPNSISQ